jgi:hypothetical protein
LLIAADGGQIAPALVKSGLAGQGMFGGKAEFGGCLPVAGLLLFQPLCKKLGGGIARGTGLLAALHQFRPVCVPAPAQFSYPSTGLKRLTLPRRLFAY